MAVEDEFRVDLEALACSAAHVTGQGEELATAHLCADNRMAAAQSGWTGASATALNTRMATWSATSRTLLTRIGKHALRLNKDGIDFAAMERENAEALPAVGAAADRTAVPARD